MSDLLQEIDDAIKREKAEKMWRENGPYLIGGAILLVVLTGVFAGWNSWKLQQDTRQTTLLVSAMETSYPETALQAAAQSLKGDHKALAQLQTAGLLAKDGKAAEALTLYKTIADGRGIPSVWRDLATLMAVRLQADTTLDTAKATALQAELKPLLSKNNPWRLHAALQAALLAGDYQNDYTGAVKLLADPLHDKNSPPSLQTRAKALDHFYTMKLAAQKAEQKG